MNWHSRGKERKAKIRMFAAFMCSLWRRARPAVVSISQERRRWARLKLAIPVFVRTVHGRSSDFLEFGTLLNVSAGGGLLALRKSVRNPARISLEIPSAPLLANVKWPGAVRILRARVVRTNFVNSWKLCGLQFVRPLV